MRTLPIAVPAVLLAMGTVAGIVGQAVLRWPAALAGAGPVVQAGTTHPAPRRLVPMDRVAFSQLRLQLEHLTEGNVVLDMRALESLEAAQDLVQHWRDNHPVDAHLVCWLATTEDDPGLASAVRALSDLGCSALHVALDTVTLTQTSPPGPQQSRVDRPVAAGPGSRAPRANTNASASASARRARDQQAASGTSHSRAPAS